MGFLVPAPPPSKIVICLHCKSHFITQEGVFTCPNCGGNRLVCAEDAPEPRPRRLPKPDNTTEWK